MRRVLLLSAIAIVIVFAALAVGYSSLAQSPVTDSQYNAPTSQPPNGTAAENSEWTLSVVGSVANPRYLTLDEIIAMPGRTVNANIYCVDYPGTIVTGGDWTGVRLGLLLESAGVLPEAVKVGFHAKDGYATDLTVEMAKRENVILAYELNGKRLSSLRLVVPGYWGYKWIDGPYTVELYDYDFKGRWESAGYPDDASISGP